MVQSQLVESLNMLEKSELAGYEAVIERGIGTFVEVGNALLSIRDKRLYRVEYGTFEDYCRERWGMGRTNADELIRASVVIENLTGVPVIPNAVSQTRPLATLPPEQQREAWQRAVETAPDGRITAGHVQRVVDEMIRKDEPPDEPEEIYSPPSEPDPEIPRMAVHFASTTPEHYTPREIIDAVLDCLGDIVLDPCSNSHDDPNVPALFHYTQEDNGLAQAWIGSVYMNPPYGREIGDWVEKLRSEHESGNVPAAIALVPARPDTKWWQRLRDYPVCFITGRLVFGGNEEAAPFPSAVFYLGDDWGLFYSSFANLGDIWRRVRPEDVGQDF